tara:strand:+ start:3960 stop:5009 length:1050 start_codon:yes stop_codon:yes gene_type:complete
MTEIFHICKSYMPHSYGGVETYVNNATNDTSKHRHMILTTSPKRTYKRGNVYYFKISTTISSDNLSLDLILFIVKNRKRIQNIHFHSPWPTIEILLLLIKSNIVVTYHSDIVYQKFLYFFYKPLQKLFLNKTKVIISTSKNYTRSSKILKNYNHKVQDIPIGLDYVRPQAIKDVKRKIIFKKYIIFIGNNRNYKGLELLQKLIKEEKFNFILIGKGLNNLKNKNVQIFSHIAESFKMRLISDSHFLILTSNLRSEAYGIVLVEALMQGKPLLTSDLNTGVTYLNKNEVNGFHFRNNSYEDLLIKTKYLYDLDKDIYENISKNNVIKYKKYLTVKIMNDQLSQIYLRFFK